MSNMEKEPILDTPMADDDVLDSLEHEPPKPLLLLIAIILGSLSMILSLVAIVQTKQEPAGSGTPGIGVVPVDGGVGLENLLERIGALEQKVSQLSAVPSEFNAGGSSAGSSALEHEVGSLRTELDVLRAKVDNLRLAASSRAVKASPDGCTGFLHNIQFPAASARADIPTCTHPHRTARGEKIHNLESGETLSALSKKYGVPLSSIESANQGLDFRKLQIGQKIIIPAAN